MAKDGPNNEKGFWTDKTPCWIVRGCILEARERCRAFHNRSLPCWEQETLCKELFGIDTCFACEVFRQYGGKRTPSSNGAGAPRQ